MHDVHIFSDAGKETVKLDITTSPDVKTEDPPIVLARFMYELLFGYKPLKDKDLAKSFEFPDTIPLSKECSALFKKLLSGKKTVD